MYSKPTSILLITLLLLGFQQSNAAAESTVARIKYVSFNTQDQSIPLRVSGRYVLPANMQAQTRVPAVLVLHGSGGVSVREETYQDALAKAGIASLAIDEWTARALPAGQRPETVFETLPDVYAARRWLMAQPEIQAKAVGVLGFSFGGVAAMLAATKKYNDAFSHDGGGFVATVPVYPVCWAYNRVPGYEFSSLNDTQIQIITGEADQYDMDSDSCAKLISSLDTREQQGIRLEVLANAHHSFDKPGEDRIKFDEYGHRGKGGLVKMLYDKASMLKSVDLTVNFFTTQLRGE